MQICRSRLPHVCLTCCHNSTHFHQVLVVAFLQTSRTFDNRSHTSISSQTFASRNTSVCVFMCVCVCVRTCACVWSPLRRGLSYTLGPLPGAGVGDQSLNVVPYFLTMSICMCMCVCVCVCVYACACAGKRMSVCVCMCVCVYVCR